jgi:hypothetical protein
MSIAELLSLSLSYYREAASTKCNVVNWDDQVSLFELAFDRYGAVDVVVCMPSYCRSSNFPVP